MEKKAHNQTHLLVFLFIIFCFTKLAITNHFPLINDEAYTLTISRYFSLSYFDHPPLTMWISYLFHNLNISDSYFFRLPSIIFSLLTGYFLYKIASTVYSQKMGTVAAILYFISPFFFFSGGFFVVPDAALNFSVTAATYISLKLIFYNEDKTHLWLMLGLFLAIAFLSKYQSYLFGITLFFSFIIWNKRLILTVNFNLAILISIFGLIPVVIWNIENNFDSFNFHQNRSSFNFDLFHVFNTLFAQFFLLLPTTGLLILMSLFNYIKSHSSRESFLVFLALPTILIFNILIFVSDNSFAHWSMMGWMLLLPMASNTIISLKSYKPQIFSLKILNVFLIFSLISIVLIHAKTGFITKNYGEKLPRWDNTRELLDWGNIANILRDNLGQSELESMVTRNWYDSGQLSSAFNYKYNTGVVGPNSHHFKYIGLELKNLITLIEVRLIHDYENINLNKKMISYGYNVKKSIHLPLLRGDRKYAIISILSLEKVR